MTSVITRFEHRWDRLIHDGELRRYLEERGIDVYEIQGVSIPISALPGAIRAYFNFKTGRGSLASLASSLQSRVGGSSGLAYIGWGITFG